jgi:hypothetical protein
MTEGGCLGFLRSAKQSFGIETRLRECGDCDLAIVSFFGNSQMSSNAAATNGMRSPIG